MNGIAKNETNMDMHQLMETMFEGGVFTLRKVISV